VRSAPRNRASAPAVMADGGSMTRRRCYLRHPSADQISFNRHCGFFKRIRRRLIRQTRDVTGYTFRFDPGRVRDG
jgi:hypothetical protein